MSLENRSDFSNYLAHFTSSREPVGNKDKKNPIRSKVGLSALDRLKSILVDKKIMASTMPWTGSHAVCFTECPWSSLIEHTNNYAPYSIGFSKNFVFSRNGAPVFYVRPDQYNKQEWHEHIKPFLTPFWPKYRPESLNDKVKFPDCDYSHEREWRVPHDLPFEYHQVEFIILDTYQDMAQFPKDLKDAIGREKFLLMDNYKMIERLWPVHNLDLK